jgi:hypothetical protein
MADLFAEDLTLDHVQWWWFNLSLRYHERINRAYRERFDHGDPEYPIHPRDLEWFLEEYADDVLCFVEEQKLFQIIGFYPDTAQRFADVCYAHTPREAEIEMIRNMDGLSVCAVLAIDGDIVDTYYGTGLITDKDDYLLENGTLDS